METINKILQQNSKKIEQMKEELDKVYSIFIKVFKSGKLIAGLQKKINGNENRILTEDLQKLKGRRSYKLGF